MGFFENTLGGLGRWMDGVVEAVREKLGSVSRPTPHRSPREWIGDQSARAAERVDEMKRQWAMAPDSQRRRATIALVITSSLLLGVSAGYLFVRMNGGATRLSGSEATALDAVQKRIRDAETPGSGTSLFHGAR